MRWWEANGEFLQICEFAYKFMSFIGW